MTHMNKTTKLLLLSFLGLLVLAALGCGGGEEAVTEPTLVGEEAEPVAAPPVQPVSVSTTVPLVVDALSTFESKDPFVPQSVTNPGGGGSNTDGSTVTTSDSTATTAPSSVSNALHSLKVLSIDAVNDIPVVTFEVDDVIYADREEGDTVDTSWGQIKVIEIDAEDQVVVFLHGSETRSLGVGQEYLK